MKRAKWPQEKRLRFIDFRLYWERQLNRVDITKFFGISIPQASLDIAKYNELAPGNAIYDTSAKIYQASDSFQPIFDTTNSSESYLKDLLAIGQNTIPVDASFIGWQPSIDSVPRPKRSVPSHILLTVLRSIEQRKILNITYLSKKDLIPKQRNIGPHAIAYDAQRWHVRAYCYNNNEFRDFVIARFLEAEINDEIAIPSEEDGAWRNILTLTLVPDSTLSKAHQQVIAHEYGMENGELMVKCREALLFYVERQLGLHRGKHRNPNEYPLELKIDDHLSNYLTHLPECG